MAETQCVDDLGHELCKQNVNADTMNEMGPSQKGEHDVMKEQGVSECVPIEQVDDGSDSPILSEEDKEDDDLVLFDLQHPLESDREGSVSPDPVMSELAAVKADRDQLRQQLSNLRTQDQQKSSLASLQERSFREIAKELETKCFMQQEQLDLLQEQLSTEQERSHSTVSNLQRELALRVDQVTKMYEDAVRERESVVARLARMDNERRQLIDSKEDGEKRARDLSKTVDKLQAQVKNEKTDVLRLQAAVDKLETTLKERSSELSKAQDELSSLNVKLKWAQNKLKAETEEHSSCKAKLQNMAKKWKEAKEEGDQLRAELKATVQTYQESEEMKSNSLGVQLKKTEAELHQQEKQMNDQMRVYDATKRELDSLKKQLKEAEEESRTSRDKLHALEQRSAEQAHSVLELTATNSKQAEEIGRLKLSIKEGEKAKRELDSLQQAMQAKEDEVYELKQACEDLQDDIASCEKKERELLSFSEKLASSNAELQTSKTSLEKKVSSLVVEGTSQSQIITGLEMRSRELVGVLVTAEKEDELAQTVRRFEGQVRDLEQRLEDRSRAVEHLSMDLEDARGEVKVQQRKNASNLKDLTKQLQQYRKRLEQTERGDVSTTSKALLPSSRLVPPSSRAQPNVDKSSPLTATVATPEGGEVSTGEEVMFTRPSRRRRAPGSPDSKQLPIDKSVLIDKLCRAHRKLAKMEEKADFTEEHIRELTEEIRRKSKIIQYYVMREEAGTLAPSSSEQHKASLSRHGGIMASVFQSRVVDPSMTLELSLEINRKLQAVLEDTLLKNITIKENLDTLGSEIARLSLLTQQQQRQLQQTRSS